MRVNVAKSDMTTKQFTDMCKRISLFNIVKVPLKQITINKKGKPNGAY